MKTEKIPVRVKEAGKGRKAMPTVTAVALLTGYKEDFEANNPILPAIDTKGNALPVGEY